MSHIVSHLTAPMVRPQQCGENPGGDNWVAKTSAPKQILLFLATIAGSARRCYCCHCSMMSSSIKLFPILCGWRCGSRRNLQSTPQSPAPSTAPNKCPHLQSYVHQSNRQTSQDKLSTNGTKPPVPVDTDGKETKFAIKMSMNFGFSTLQIELSILNWIIYRIILSRINLWYRKSMAWSMMVSGSSMSWTASKEKLLRRSWRKARKVCQAKTPTTFPLRI